MSPARYSVRQPKRLCFCPGSGAAIGGGMGVGWILRAVAMAIALVVGTLVVLKALPGAAMHPLLSAIEAQLVSASAPVETYLIAPVAGRLGQHGITSEVAPHWPAFAVMFFLLFISIGRIAPPQGTGAQILQLTWSALCAMIAGAVAGTFGLGEARLMWWALAGIALWNFGLQFVITRFSLSAFAALGLFLLFAAMAFGLIPGRLHPVPDAQSPGLAGTAVAIGALALGLMGLATFGDGRQGADAWLGDRYTREGLSMLAVLAAIMLASVGLA